MTGAVPAAAPGADLATRGPGETLAGVAVPALPGGPADRYGVRHLTATWLAGYAAHTRTAYARDLAHFLDWCQRCGLDPLAARPADLDGYRATLEHPPAAATPPGPATVHRRLSALSSWYQYLAANGGGAATNPVAATRRPRVDRDASATAGLATDEVRALLRSIDDLVRERAPHLITPQPPGRQLPAGQPTPRQLAALRDRALVRMLADLGLRVGELLALDVAALSYNRGRRTLRYLDKGGRRRERPLTPHALEALDDYLVARAAAAGTVPDRLTGPLLATTGRDGTSGRLTEPAAFRLVRRLARRAGLPAADRLSPHSLRHAFATNARELGVPLEDVQDAMGHADTRTTRRYDRARHALHRDPALRLGDLYAGGTDTEGVTTAR